MIRNTGEPAKNVDQPLPLPQGVSNLAVGVGDEPELAWMLMALTLVALLTLFFRCHVRQTR